MAAVGNTYFIRAGTFQAAVLEDRLTEMPRPQFRKLLQLARAYPENLPALAAMGKDIQRQVIEAEAAWKAASQDYKANWKHVAHPRSRKPAIMKIMEENRRLKEAVRITKGHYANWVSVQTNFQKEGF